MSKLVERLLVDASKMGGINDHEFPKAEHHEEEGSGNSVQEAENLSTEPKPQGALEGIIETTANITLNAFNHFYDQNVKKIPELRGGDN